MIHYAKVDLNGWDEEDRLVVQLEADVKYLEAERDLLKEQLGVALGECGRLIAACQEFYILVGAWGERWKISAPPAAASPAQESK